MRNQNFGTLWQQNRNPVAPHNPKRGQMLRKLVCALLQLLVRNLTCFALIIYVNDCDLVWHRIGPDITTNIGHIEAFRYPKFKAALQGVPIFSLTENPFQLGFIG
jgi:hypothetical protein